MSEYWEKRKDSIYLFAAKQICARYSKKARSYIDVGSNGTPIIEWHRNQADKMVSLDVRKPYYADGVESIKINFLEYYPPIKYDIATCFQVLEHVPNAHAFAENLLLISKTLIVSVPYKWEKERNMSHIHDPVDELKMLEWFKRDPDFSYLATEISGVKRLIQVYKTKQLLVPEKPMKPA
jgi:hypothetical protein